MIDNIHTPPSLVAEAANMDTSSDRLEELALLHPTLKSIVAANPATSPALITSLSQEQDPVIRQAVAQNPNAPIQVLCQLASHFPREFLDNPLLPLLNLTATPGSFLPMLSIEAWGGLLRYEDLPQFWFPQLQADIRFQSRSPLIWNLIKMHVTLAGETKGTWWKKEGHTLLRRYQSKISSSSNANSYHNHPLFVLFMLLFPPAITMLKQQWVSLLHQEPHLGKLLLSSGVAISHKTLTLLTNDRNPSIKRQVGRHPQTPAKALRQLAAHTDTAMRRAVASNVHTPLVEITYQLAADPATSVRNAAATHPLLTHEDLEILALDNNPSVRAVIAARHHLSPDLYRQLANDTASAVRASLARNAQTPQETLVLLASDTEPSVRVAVASNPRLPLHAMTRLLEDDHEGVRASLAGNARLPAHFCERLAYDPSLSVRKYVAANMRTSPELLATLLSTNNMEIWQGIARHRHVSPALLAHLAQHGDILVRAAVAAHKRTPIETLSMLAQEPAHAIGLALASNPHLPLAIIEQLIAREGVELWCRLINHPTVLRDQHRPFHALFFAKSKRLMLTDALPSWFRRVAFQYSTALPPTMLEVFATSPFWEERYLVARHPRMSEAILTTLAHDGISYVRVVARTTLQQRQPKSTQNSSTRPSGREKKRMPQTPDRPAKGPHSLYFHLKHLLKRPDNQKGQ